MFATTIRDLRDDELHPAALLLSRAMCDNPIDVRAFDGEPGHRRRVLERFYRAVLQGLYRRGQVLGAFCKGEMTGICGIASPGHCQPTLIEKARIFPTVVIGTRPGTVTRVLKWAGEWSRRDPLSPHWHLGPVAVQPAMQGKGIGGAMMARFCAMMDQSGEVSYLETDKRENVSFYERFSFAVIAEADVLGVRNWFMTRPAIGAAGSRVGPPPLNE